MNIECIIIDDEHHCIDTLKWQLENYVENIQVKACFDNPEKALEFLSKNKIDLLFLDIEMPEMNGFEFLEKIEIKNFDVIFITAYDEFALKAFSASAIDYLLKPIDKESITTALNKVKKKQQKAVLPAQLEILYKTLDIKNNSKERIAVPTQEGLLFLKIKEIMYCISDSNYTEIYLTTQKKIVVSKILKDIEALLENEGFLRIHHSHLINLKKIERFIRGDGGYVVMDDKKTLSVSRSRKEKLLSCFNI